jgi:type II secretory pathway pseudopilin PulG
MIRTNRRQRTAFTLVELMIGAAITVLIMTILSVCFQTSMQAMSAMRAQGDAADQLRALTTVMKRDFKADRCLPAEGSTTVRNRGRRISDYQMNVAGSAGPASGFLYLESPPSTNEGNDGSFDSFRNAPGGAYPLGTRLWMTCVHPGGDDSKIFTATSGGNVFSSEAAEIAYFLQPMAGNTNAGPFAGGGTLALFNLHRRQRLVATDTARQAALPTNDPEVISMFEAGVAPPNPDTVHTMTSIANPALRPALPAPLTGARTGDDIILSNVLSFEVKPMWSHQNGFRDPVPFSGRAAVAPNIAYGPNHDAPFDDLTKATANTGWTFDSLTPMPIRMNAMQLRIRIYDPKVKTARQVTMIVDL